MSERVVYLATRGSALALAQTQIILEQCRELFPQWRFERKAIKTTGDKLQTASLANANLPKGLFTKELETALLAGEADLAIHSLKDLPTELPAGLKLGAVSQRADVRDVLIYRGAAFLASEPECDWAGQSEPAKVPRRGFGPGLKIADLPNGATVATGSTRRCAQLLDLRSDLKIVPIRGNVGTRLNKLAALAELDALVLAVAGLDRLGLRIDEKSQLRGENVANGLLATPIQTAEMLPCVGQAAIGIEIRANDPLIEQLCEKLNDYSSMQCVCAERAFLRGMGGGCQIAVGAHAEARGENLYMRVVSFLSDRPIRREGQGLITAPDELGQRLAKQVVGAPG